MVASSKQDQLREMAAHRGLKLVKSRRRKAGVGDYGKFGLTDASGKALLGMGKDGLTASADDIEIYLRTDARDTWKESADSTPETPAPSPKPEPSNDDPPVIRRVRKPAPRAKQPPDEAIIRDDLKRSKHVHRPSVEPAPELRIRPAKSKDAAALAILLTGLNRSSIDAEMARLNLAAVRKAGGGVLLAEIGAPIACCGWALVPTPHRGLVGRITIIFVQEDQRRKGIATRLIAEATGALAKKGCTLVEVMSDIEIRNSHNFFRSIGYEQASYRFTRTIEDTERVG